MSTYSTWAVYSGDYGGGLAEAAYARAAPLAALEIDRLSFGRAATAAAEMAGRLALCECRMVDVIAASQALGLAPGVCGVRNDGIAVSVSGDAATALAGQVEHIARQTLTAPVNLLFGGAVVKNVQL